MTIAPKLLWGMLLALAATWSWWLTRDPGEAVTTTSSAFAGSRIDYYLSTLDAVSMSTQGTPLRSLQALHLEHDRMDDTTSLQQPVLEIFDPEAPRWTVQAQEGWVSGDGTLVLLEGDVDIHREGDPDHEPMRLLTQRLRVRPEEDYAETDDPVTITRGPDRVDAVGMQAWMRKPVRIKLLAEARGHYVPR